MAFTLKTIHRKNAIKPTLEIEALEPRSLMTSFQGNGSGIFTNHGPASAVVSGLNTNHFTWGTGSGTPASSLTYTGASFAITTDHVFSLGTLSYFNGTIVGGTEATSVQLRVNVNLVSPSTISSQEFTYPLGLVNSPNTGDPDADADSVLLALPAFPTQEFVAPDQTVYTLEVVGFGTVSGNGFSTINQFFVREGGTASANLLGKFIVSPPDIAVKDATTENFTDFEFKYSISDADSPPVTFQAYLSTDSIFDENDSLLNGQLRIEDSASLKANIDGTAKTYSAVLHLNQPAPITRDRRYIFVVADQRDEIRERSELNNQMFVIPNFQRGTSGGFRLGTDIFSFSTTEEAAVDSIKGRISRGTNSFTQLVNIQSVWANRGGVFPLLDGDPYKGDDYLVQSNAVEPIIQLADMIQSAKSAERLSTSFFSINDAFDEQIDHSNNSTHYEGRAIDVDGDANAIGKMAGLALLSGFDWVWNEPDDSNSHLHASVRGSSAEITAGEIGRALDFGRSGQLITSQSRYSNLKSLINSIELQTNIVGPLNKPVIFTLIGSFISQVNAGIAAGEIRQGFAQRNGKQGLLIYNITKLKLRLS